MGGMLAMDHPVFQRAQFGRRDPNDIAHAVSEAATRFKPVLDWCVHGAEKQSKAVGILMVLPYCLVHELKRVAADQRHRRSSRQAVPVVPHYFEGNNSASHIIH